nr:reverse transcriptase domain-containing protein [Tanacetum cinerariifolium]
MTNEKRSMLGHRRQSAFDRLSETYSPSTTKSRPRGTDFKDHPRGRSRPHKLDTSNEDCPENKERFRGVRESYDDSYSHFYHDENRSRHMKRRRDNESPLYSVLKSDSSDEKYRKSRGSCQNFPTAAQVERWAMPTWCHIFNSTLIGAARVWFDELPPESVDSYKDLKAAFLAYFMQQKKYVKDPVEIHNIKQKDGETIEDFIERFKVETGRMKGAPECMWISGFMHGVNNPELTKRLNEHVPKTTEEMMITTTAFIRGEVVAASKKKGHTSWNTQDQPKRQTSKKRSDFRVEGRIVTIRSTILIPAECTSVITSSTISKEEGTHPENFKVVLHPDFPDQEVAIGGTLSAKGRTELCSILKKNLDIFAWQPSDMTGVPRSVTEHRLNIREGYSTVRQKKRGQAPEHAKAIQAEVQKLVEIQLAEPDEEKTSFHTRQGVYCYTKMPFGLKNAGATYQRLVDKAFDSQIGRNIEVYVDDLVVKSYTEAEMLRDIDETFRTLRKINMKLNPKKCTFGAEEGVFLGYVVTPEGIKPCLDKIAAVLQLPSPWTIKESDFHWTAEAEQAFKQLKQHLSELPLLVAPKPKEELIIYLSATYRAISAVLMTERGATQTPIYFISRALQGPKLNYTPMKKLVLSLVFAAKRLQRTTIETECHARRTQYHIPAKNVSERTDPNGFSYQNAGRKSASRASGRNSTRAFAASNNEAEYEALIAGLRISAQMGVQNIHVSVDSKLVANQVLGTYVSKEENMIKYLDKVKSLVSGFTNFSISQAQSQNKKADALSKIASTSFAHLSKQVLVEILKEKSIKEKEVTTVVEEDGPTWMTPIMEYLKERTLPSDRKEARKLRIKAQEYELLEGILYRRSFLTSWLRCVGPLQAEYVIREIHEGSCSMHAGPRSVVARAIWLGYYWPTMHRDIEAKAVATITGSQVKKFVWDNIVCRFYLPREIVSDKYKQFSDNPFKYWCDKLNITQRFAPVKHPQSNGLVERANRSLREGIKARMGEGNKNWVEELPHVLWAHRTMIKSSHVDTPSSLTYGTEAVIPVEIGMPTYRTAVLDVVYNDEELRLNLDLLEERRERATIREAKAKLKMIKYYNARVRGVTFRPGPKWEGPYEVTEALGDGAYKLRSTDGTVLPRT